MSLQPPTQETPANSSHKPSVLLQLQRILSKLRVEDNRTRLLKYEECSPNLGGLPMELHLLIFEQLDQKHFARCAWVCQRLRASVLGYSRREELLWLKSEGVQRKLFPCHRLRLDYEWESFIDNTAADRIPHCVFHLGTNRPVRFDRPRNWGPPATFSPTVAVYPLLLNLPEHPYARLINPHFIPLPLEQTSTNQRKVGISVTNFDEWYDSMMDISSSRDQHWARMFISNPPIDELTIDLFHSVRRDARFPYWNNTPTAQIVEPDGVRFKHVLAKLRTMFADLDRMKDSAGNIGSLKLVQGWK